MSWDVYRQVVADLGVELVEYANPANRGGRWKKDRPHGQMVHHTAPPNPYPLDRLNGTTDTRLKSNVTPRADGRLYLLAEGACNYSSGMGLSTVLDDVIAGAAPRGRARDLGYTRADDDTNGNPWFINYEVDHPGDGTPLPESQFRALVAGLVAGCVAFGLAADSTISHGEWTARKHDPSWNGLDAHENLNLIRTAIDEVLDMQYRGVLNVPDADWARRVVDWGIDTGVIVTGDDHPDDWNDDALTMGRIWTLLYRNQ